MVLKRTGRLLGVAGALALAAPIFAVPAAAQRCGEVAAPIVPLNLRAGPSDFAGIIGVLHPGCR